MKKKDKLLVGGLLAVALVGWIFMKVWMPQQNEKIRITVDGELYGEYRLDQPQLIEINDTNVCEIRDGKVKMITADCPDQLCVHQKAIDEKGGSIICLPNRVVIEGDGNLEDGQADEVA